MKEKPFLSFNRQMRHLRNCKMIDCNGSLHKSFLVKYGYFNLINAYKDPFVLTIDHEDSHVYIGGTSIDHFVSLKIFDDNLRMLLLSNITRIEEEIRNLLAYKLDAVNSQNVEWYETNAYDRKYDVQTIVRTISSCFQTIDLCKNSYVDHYTKKYGRVPTWIFTKVIKFSELIDVIKISKSEVKESICKLYSILDKRERPNHNLLLNSLHEIRVLRNVCAHNERVVFFRMENQRINQPFIKFINSSKRYTKERDLLLIDIIVTLKYFLDNNEFVSFIEQFTTLLLDLKSRLNASSFDKVRGGLGIKTIDDLDYLRNSNKMIKNYNAF